MVACSHKNLIVNGDFRSRLYPWTGKRIMHVRNPLNELDYSVLMEAPNTHKQSILSQRMQVKPEEKCAYHLTFRIINVSPNHLPIRFYAIVAYLDKKGRLIRSTPLLLTLPEQSLKKYKPYFSIIPPPPNRTEQCKVVFLLLQGRLFIDMIRFVSYTV